MSTNEKIKSGPPSLGRTWFRILHWSATGQFWLLSGLCLDFCYILACKNADVGFSLTYSWVISHLSSMQPVFNSVSDCFQLRSFSPSNLYYLKRFKQYFHTVEYKDSIPWKHLFLCLFICFTWYVLSTLDVLLNFLGLICTMSSFRSLMVWFHFLIFL